MPYYEALQARHVMKHAKHASFYDARQARQFFEAGQAHQFFDARQPHNFMKHVKHVRT